MIAQRILAVAAAVLMIGAFALATLGPPGVPLGHVLFLLTPTAVNWVSAHLPSWAWMNLIMPLMLRPAWLLPASFGIVSAGASMTLASRPQTHRSRQQRR